MFPTLRPSDEDSMSPKLQECMNYTNTDGVRTGCDLQVDTSDYYNILLNGTLDNKLIRNTFSRALSDKGTVYVVDSSV